MQHLKIAANVAMAGFVFNFWVLLLNAENQWGIGEIALVNLILLPLLYAGARCAVEEKTSTKEHFHPNPSEDIVDVEFEELNDDARQLSSQKFTALN